jgi:hypothetical protein
MCSEWEVSYERNVLLSADDRQMLYKAHAGVMGEINGTHTQGYTWVDRMNTRNREMGPETGTRDRDVERVTMYLLPR